MVCVDYIIDGESLIGDIKYQHILNKYVSGEFLSLKKITEIEYIALAPTKALSKEKELWSSPCKANNKIWMRTT